MEIGAAAACASSWRETNDPASAKRVLSSAKPPTNQPMVDGTATHTAEGMLAPEMRSATRPAATAVTNWTSATVPMPSTLPASSW